MSIKTTASDIEHYAAELNAKGFTKEFNWRWEARRRELPHGAGYETYLDRRDLREDRRSDWRPTEEEMGRFRGNMELFGDKK